MTEQKTPEQKLKGIIREAIIDDGGCQYQAMITAIKDAAQVFADIAMSECCDDAECSMLGCPKYHGNVLHEAANRILEATEGL